jgi:hypothetical protein
MKPKFEVGQRVRVVRASADWDAPVGALGVVASYDGANHSGTDWEVGFLRDDAVAYEPAWPIDEGCLEAAGSGASDTLAFPDHCLAPDGSWLDEIATTLLIEDQPDRDARLAEVIELLQPVVGGIPLATHYTWIPRCDGGGDLLEFLTIWCDTLPWAGIVASLRARFGGSCSVVDDGWSLEFAVLQAEGARAFFGPRATAFRLFVDPWSTFERRPKSMRYRPDASPA